MNFFLKKLHLQKLFWKPNSKIVLCWAFYCVNDNKEVDLIAFQTNCCILCHNNLVLNLNSKIQARKRLIIYNTIDGITTLRKHVKSNQCNIFKKIEKINSPLKEDERQPFKKRRNIFPNFVSRFFCCKRTFQER
jgi:hypothetical protein